MHLPDPAAHPEIEASPRALLGPFVLERPIGSGGMGEVWRAVHRDEHVPVAIKVIGQHWARQPSYRQAFQREVRAIAGLVHPGIVAVHDQGVVGAAAARASGLAADSPYLVMEYMPRGSLESLVGRLDWPLAQVLVREILDALAHAHARGIVHCDLKPGNVLLSGTVDVAIKLTDFGVAHALAPSQSLADDARRSAGTPAYMAPEQLLGQWRDFGPWTDLYALGCMLWELCCGLPPFVATSLVRLAGLHLHEPPGTFAPCFAVPEALAGWLRRLLAKHPQARFACAADAAWAFAQLPGPPAPEKLAWAAVAARAEEVDRAAPTQPLPTPVGGATREGQRSWGARSTELALMDVAATGDEAREEAAEAGEGREVAGAVDVARNMSFGAGAGGTERTVAADVAVQRSFGAGAERTVAVDVAGDMSFGAGTATAVAVDAQDVCFGAGAAGTVAVDVAGDMSFGAGAGGTARTVAVERARDVPVGTERTVAVDVAGDMSFGAGAGGTARTVAVEVVRDAAVGTERTVAVDLAAGSDPVAATRLAAAEMPQSWGVSRDMSLSAGASGQVSGDMLAPADTPPLPASWRRSADAAVHRPLQGAGLALYRFREVPLVGREAERDALWAALAQVHAEGRPRALLVHGPSGIGKSRLVEWLATRGHEAGAATVLRASHGPFGGAGDGLPRMLASHLQCVGLDGDEVHARVLAALSGDVPKDRSESLRAAEALRYEAAALTEFMLPGGDGERPRVRLAEQRERHAVLAGYLKRVTALRPALLWLDDAMWGPEALDFTRFLLTAGAGPRALLVLTIRDDLLAERPAEARVIAELAALPGVTSLAVAPLTEAEHRALIHERLGLDADLVEAVLARAGGNPLFSVQLVGDWIARGLLTHGPTGFALPADASLELPDDMHALWQERLARLLAQHFTPEDAEAARQALELAAALGLEIDPQAWSRGCTIAGLRPPSGLVDLLIAQRLAVATGGGWAFVHGMLRESLEDLAAAAGRRAQHHRTCAAILRALHGEHAHGHAEELARHLIAAGDLAAAMQPLLDATYQMQLSGQYERAERVLGEHATLADRLLLPQDDIGRLRGRMQRVWLTWMRGGEGSLALARARCREVEIAARRAGHDDVLGEALRWHGLVARFERRFDESLAALAQAAAAFARAGDPGGQARTALATAVTLRALGRLDAAEAELAEAERLAAISELGVLLPRVAGNLAEIALQRGDWEAAEHRFARALAAAEAIGDRKAIALTLGGAGDLALARGRLDDADARHARAEALFAALGSRYVHGVRLHRATVALLKGEVARARAFMAGFVDDPRRDALDLAHAQLGLALCAGREGQVGEVEALLAAAQAQLARVGETRRVIVLLLQAIAAALREAGAPALAAEVAAQAQAHEARLHAAS